MYSKDELIARKDEAFTATVLSTIVFGVALLKLFGIDLLGLLLFLAPIGIVVGIASWRDYNNKLNQLKEDKING